MFDKNNPLRMAIVGCGGRGVGTCLEMQEAGLGRVTAVCDKNEKALKKAKETYASAFATREVAEIGARKDVDAVFVATPDDIHVSVALELKSSGKHLLVEKPLAISIEDCDRLVNGFADRRQTVQMVGLCMRFTNLMMRSHHLVADGAIGEVLMAHCVDHVSVGGDYYFHRWMSRKEHVVGLLLQKGCHSLDYISWIISSRPVKVHAFGGLDYYGGDEPAEKRCSDCDRFEDCSERMGALIQYDYRKDAVKAEDSCAYSREVDVCDNSVVNVVYESGAKLSYSECHFSPDYVREFVFVGTKGRLVVRAPHNGPQELYLSFRHRPRKVIHETIELDPGGHGGGDRAMLAEFVSAINEGRAPLTDFAAGRECAAISISAEKSIETGEVVEIRNVDGSRRVVNVRKGRSSELSRTQMTAKSYFKL